MLNMKQVTKVIAHERIKLATRLQQLSEAQEALLPLVNGVTKGHAKRVLSLDARKRIAEAQRKRWAKVKAKKSKPQLTLVQKAAGQHRKAPHWTQLPKNRKRVAELARKMTRARIA